MSKGVTIYFMRHGETYLNRYNRIQGWADAPLTDRGIHDVERSALGLADVEFAGIYASDLQRAVQTAEIVKAYNKQTASALEIVKKPEFREEFFGSFEGLDAESVWDNMIDYVKAHYPEKNRFSSDAVRNEINAFHILDPVHEAEDFQAFWSRVELGLIDVVTRHRETDQNILVVSHGMTIRNMVHELIPEFSLGSFLDNGSVSIIRYQDGLYHLDAYNQTSHFAIDDAVSATRKNAKRSGATLIH